MTDKMTQKPSGNNWMTAEEFGKSLRGFGINLLVADVAKSVSFAETVLQAECQYQEPAFACMKRADAIWQYHADFTYKGGNALYGFVTDDAGQPISGRGIGAELHFFDLDPDAACTRASAAGYMVLAEPADKPHGVREAYILDDDGYCWVASLPLK